MELIYLVEDKYQIKNKENAEKLEKFISFYRNKGFNNPQIKEIVQGLLYGIDYSIYAKLDYDYKQMYEIRTGLIHGIDVSYYKDNELDSSYMSEIRRALENKLDLSWYNSDYNVYQLIEIIRSQNEGFDYKILLDPKLQPFEIRELRTNKVKFYYYKLKRSFSK